MRPPVCRPRRSQGRTAIVLAAVLCVSLLAAACASNKSTNPLREVTITDAQNLPVIPRPRLHMNWRKTLVEYQPFAGNPLQYSKPTVSPDGDHVFVGTSSGWMVAVNAHTGQTDWKVNFGSRIDSEPAFMAVDNEDFILFGDDDGNFRSISADDGSEIWSYKTTAEIDGGGELAEGRVFFLNSADELYALDARTGKYLWTYGRELPDYFTLGNASRPLVHEGTVISGFADGFLTALYLDTGEEIWEADLRNGERDFTDVDGQPVVAGDMLYAASHAGGLYALNVKSGRILWRQDITGASTSLVAGDTLYTTTAGRRVMALDRKTGQILWQYRHKESTPSTPTRLGGYLSYGDSNDGFYMIDRSSGYPLLHFESGSGFSAPVTFFDTRAYGLSNNGYLYSFEVVAR